MRRQVSSSNAPRASADLRLAVVGGGFSGWAACQAASARGVRPVWLNQGFGASEQSCGAGDASPWADGRGVAQIPEEIVALFHSWGLFSVQADYVATSAGVVRPTDAVGRGVLGLDAFRGRTVGILDTGRANFQANALASALQAEPWATESQTRFVPLRLQGGLPLGLSQVPLGALQSLLDQPEVRARFSEALRALTPELTGVSALLCEPLLGLAPEKIDSPLPLGETLSPPEGAFGFRVAAARRNWLQTSGLEMYDERVESIGREAGQVRVVSRLASGELSTRWVDVVIIATGGLVAGGVGLIPQASGQWGDRLGTLLSSGPAVPSGDWEGWDAQADAGAWTSPHYSKSRAVSRVAAPGSQRSRIVVVGDARSAGSEISEPVGTVLGAAISAMKAVNQLFEGD